MYIVYKSKVPLFHQLGKMADNLCEKLNKTAYVSIGATSYNHLEKKDCIKHEFRISLVPGFDERCSAWYPKTWEETLKIYTKLMKGK